MLHLAQATDPSWTVRALAHIDEILLDHAHCEKKAASTAMSLIFRYPERPALAIPLARLAREELAHFEEVIHVLRARGGEYRRLTPSPYAARLMSAVFSGWRKMSPSAVEAAFFSQCAWSRRITSRSASARSIHAGSVAAARCSMATREGSRC